MILPQASDALPRPSTLGRGRMVFRRAASDANFNPGMPIGVAGFLALPHNVPVAAGAGYASRVARRAPVATPPQKDPLRCTATPPPASPSLPPHSPPSKHLRRE